LTWNFLLFLVEGDQLDVVIVIVGERLNDVGVGNCAGMVGSVGSEVDGRSQR
jgi:hypothetical protein